MISSYDLFKTDFISIGNETDELQAAITNSIDDFQKEKTAEMLLKHNEHLQTQLAMESSKRDVILKNAQDMSEELNELFLSQKSQDEEIFKRENQNLLSEKEKLEVEVAILKSEQEVAFMVFCFALLRIISLFLYDYRTLTTLMV